MIYGIKIINDVVLAIISISSDQSLPNGFTSITESEYNDGINIVKAGARYLSYDSNTKTMSADSARSASQNTAIEKLGIRSRIKALNNEKELKTLLSEDTTAIDASIAGLVSSYGAL